MKDMQRLGLWLNLVGTILFGWGALDTSRTTWEDVARKSKRAKCTCLLAWIGVILIVIGFFIQICAI